MFPGFEPSQFAVSTGGTLEDVFDDFRAAVTDRVVAVLSEAVGTPVILVEGDEHDEIVDAVVLVTQGVPPAGGSRIGEAEYDPCNTSVNDSAVIFGESIRRLAAGRAYSFQQWVNVFANVIAHEAAHTLGFGHIERDSAARPHELEPIELMLDGHTFEEMCREQRAFTPQSLCPAADEHPSLAASSME